MYRVDRTRRSAKQTVTEMIEEILKRPDCDAKAAKLDLLQTIASRMSWMDLFDKIRYGRRERVVPAATMTWMPYKD